jgi:hypothetical protein
VGAAWATAASFWALAFLVLLVSNRIYPVPWDWRRCALVLTLTTSLCLASLATDAWLPIVESLPVRLAITAAFPLLLLLLRFFPASDLDQIRRALRRV